MSNLIINREELEEVLRQKILDSAIISYGTNGGANAFIMESMDSLDLDSVAGDILEELEDNNFVESTSNNYTVSDKLYNKDSLEGTDEDVEEQSYFDCINIDEIDTIIHEHAEKAYESMKLTEKFSRAYNNYVRTEIEDLDGMDDCIPEEEVEW